MTRQIRDGVRAVYDPDFPIEHLTQMVRVIAEDEDLAPDWTHELVKTSKSKVYRFSDGQTVVYVKHYNNPTNLAGVKDLLRPPLRLAKLAASLAKDGIPVMSPIAALYIRRRRGRCERMFVSREVPGKLLSVAIADGSLGCTERLRIAEILGSIWGRLLSRGYMHMDPTPRNFVYQSTQQGPRITLIDLDDITRLPTALTSRVHLLTQRRLTKFVFRMAAHLAINDEPPIQPGEVRQFRRSFRTAGGPEAPNPRTWWRQVRSTVRRRWQREYLLPYPYRKMESQHVRKPTITG